ncbi:MAG: hypothetical protein Q4F72_01380 [Desulfovibrionaceae bacterium]|nr:hypothetical protein [Desulfovibrionaceae bacterium]
MQIEWTINKERGNLRPVLSYRAKLEEHEKALAVPQVRILSSIPQPEERNQKFCYPGAMERSKDYKPSAFYTLETPSHIGHPMLHSLTLPWREDNAYPEVEESFGRLRDALEAEIRRACESEPMEETGSVHASTAGKARLAPSVAAARFLRLVQNQE